MSAAWPTLVQLGGFLSLQIYSGVVWDLELLRSRHGESAYIIEQGWNLVVNRPEFWPHLIGRGISN